ncbi:galactose-6-phosphate isomerase subunit LacA [Bacillus sp. HMF5848]|uniref:galactose-6-phosphate isomerase subunit LacA n=1 Tax=Bacillus sp. HMF5848 TaxID=2495421 RepID=UPI000F7ADC0A|nr:galactose-6-phosphate isomerase subunit LacA [Bacillus sp. HMF5848]RSK28795.1 galactose-6-phosphate isomerase subunit LacA [Bacillus sp. HMF5848]
MQVILGADVEGFQLKEHIKQFLLQQDYDVMDVTPQQDNHFVTATNRVVEEVKGTSASGIIIDKYGVGSFMVANKCKGVICANVSDEHTAKMTRDHNNTSIITIGSGMIGTTLAERIVEVFLQSEYSGGRHQIRVDMLNKMC